MFILYSLKKQRGYMIYGNRDIALTELQLAKEDEPDGMWILGFRKPGKPLFLIEMNQ